MFLTNCKIHTMEDGLVIEDGFIEIEGKTIASVGKMSDFSESCPDIINLNGAEVYPGFIDAHTHLGMWEDAIGFEGDDGNEDTDPSLPQLRAIDAVNPVDRCFGEALAAGVTAVLTGPGSSNPIAGQIAAISTYGRRIDDMILKQPAAIKFALGENPKNAYHSKNQAPVTRMATASIIREQLICARRYLDDLTRAESDPDYDKPEFDFKCESLIPLLKREIQAHFHAHRADDIFTACRIADEFGLDLVIVHGTGGYTYADILAKDNIPVLCGPLICDRSKPELAGLTPSSVGIFNRGGVRTAIVTDHPDTPAQYLTLSASLAVKNGLEHDEAIRAITINPAKICRIDDIVGSIRAGKRADLVVYEKGGDPIAIGSTPSAVFVGGEKVV